MDRIQREKTIADIIVKNIHYILIGLMVLLLVNHRYLLYQLQIEIDNTRNELSASNNSINELALRNRILKESMDKDALFAGESLTNNRTKQSNMVKKIVVTIKKQDYQYVTRDINFIVRSMKNKRNDIAVEYYFSEKYDSGETIEGHKILINKEIVEKYNSSIILVDKNEKIIKYFYLTIGADDTIIKQFVDNIYNFLE